MNEHDNFGDVIQKSTGIFDTNSASIAGAEGGLSDFDRPATQPTPQGVAVTMSCRGCGRPAQLMIEYPELVAIQYNVQPHVAFARMQPSPVTELIEWRYSSTQQAWFPVRECPYCKTMCAPLFTSEEATAHLLKARRSNWTHPEAERKLSIVAYQVAEELAQRAQQRLAPPGY